MHIDSVTNAQYVGVIDYNTGKSKRMLDIKYNSGVNIKDDAGRVYLIVSDGIIKKIGGSQSRGGIKSTFSFYISANQGRPSIRSFGVMMLIANELKQGKNVEIYMIQSEQVKASVKGLFSDETMNVSAFKEMESKCINDYKQLVGDYPEWNYQESGKAWSVEIQQQHANMLSHS